MRWCFAGLVLLSAVLTVSAQTNAVGQGIITVLDGKFVDANCREYQFAGLLAFILQHQLMLDLRNGSHFSV